MKAVNLSITVLVLVVLLTITAISIIGPTLSVFGAVSPGTTADSVKNSACLVLQSTGCESPSSVKVDFDADLNGVVDNNDDLQDLCDNYYNAGGSAAECRKKCRCIPGYQGGGGGNGNGDEPTQECSDGTIYGECSSNKPKYCDNGNLIDRCSVCGCPSDYECQSDGTCEIIILETCNDQCQNNGYGAGECVSEIPSDSWLPADAQLIAKTDFSDITISGTFRQGVPQWYPDVQTWMAYANSGDLVITQHPADSNRKALKITFDGKRDDQSPIRPSFSVFMNAQNTITDGIEEAWVEAKHFYPSDSHVPGRYMIAEPFIQYEKGPQFPVDYSVHTYDANLYVWPDSTGDYLELIIKERGYNPDGTTWQVEPFKENWNKQLKLPKGREFTLRWHVKRHETDGILEMWLDGQKILDYHGPTVINDAWDWRIIPFDHYCDPGAPVTTNYLTYVEVWGRDSTSGTPTITNGFFDDLETIQYTPYIGSDSRNCFSNSPLAEFDYYSLVNQEQDGLSIVQDPERGRVFKVTRSNHGTSDSYHWRTQIRLYTNADYYIAGQSVKLPTDFALTSPTNKWFAFGNMLYEWSNTDSVINSLAIATQIYGEDLNLAFTHNLVVNDDRSQFSNGFMTGISLKPYLGQWIDFKWEVYRHPTDGYVKLYMNNQLIATMDKESPFTKGIPAYMTKITDTAPSIQVVKHYCESDEQPNTLYFDNIWFEDLSRTGTTQPSCSGDTSIGQDGCDAGEECCCSGTSGQCTPGNDIIEETEYPSGSCSSTSTLKWSHSTCGNGVCYQGSCKDVDAHLTYTTPSGKIARSDSVSIPYTISNIGDIKWCFLTEMALTKFDGSGEWRSELNSLSTGSSASDSVSYSIECSDPLGPWSGSLYTTTGWYRNDAWDVWGPVNYNFQVVECLNNQDCVNCRGSGYTCDTSTNTCKSGTTSSCYDECQSRSFSYGECISGTATEDWVPSDAEVWFSTDFTNTEKLPRYDWDWKLSDFPNMICRHGVGKAMNLYTDVYRTPPKSLGLTWGDLLNSRDELTDPVLPDATKETDQNPRPSVWLYRLPDEYWLEDYIYIPETYHLEYWNAIMNPLIGSFTSVEDRTINTLRRNWQIDLSESSGQIRLSTYYGQNNYLGSGQTVIIPWKNYPFPRGEWVRFRAHCLYAENGRLEGWISSSLGEYKIMDYTGDTRSIDELGNIDTHGMQLADNYRDWLDPNIDTIYWDDVTIWSREPSPTGTSTTDCQGTTIGQQDCPTGELCCCSGTAPDLIPSDARLIAKTDFSDITLSNTYRQGVPEWYPQIQTWVGWANEGDIVIAQHPTDPTRKSMKITFDGMRKDQSPIRPMFSIFLNDPYAVTEPIDEFWVEAKYFFPTDFAITTSNPWLIFCEPFVEYESHPDLNYTLHNFDANFYTVAHPTEDFNYLQLSIVRRGLTNGEYWSDPVFEDRWDKQRPLPQGEEFTLKWHVKRHRTVGVFELWLNDEKIVDFIGQTTEQGEVGREDQGWRTIPLDHYCDSGNPITSNYLTYLEVWGK